MGVIIAAIILSGVVIVPTLAGLFVSGNGSLLRVIGAILVLPLLGVLLWIGASVIFKINIGQGDGWLELSYFVMSFLLGVVGAIIGGIGRAMARRQAP